MFLLRYLCVFAVLVGFSSAVRLGCDTSPMDGCPSGFGPTDDKWTFFVFTQTWEGSFCDDGCCTVRPIGFSIHGLWPNYDEARRRDGLLGDSYPSCCKVNFDINNAIDKIEGDLKADLAYFWPVLKRPGFYEYEFSKHGTCAMSLFSNPEDYFRAALGLRKKVDLLTVLANNGIVPDASATYRSSAISSAVQQSLSVRPVLSCTRQGQLAEIRLCVSKSTTPTLIDCPSGLSSSCPKEVRFPPLGSSNTLENSVAIQSR